MKSVQITIGARFLEKSGVAVVPVSSFAQGLYVLVKREAYSA